MKKFILPDQPSQEFVFPVLRFLSLAIRIEDHQLISLIGFMVEDQTALVDLRKLDALLQFQVEAIRAGVDIHEQGFTFRLEKANCVQYPLFDLDIGKISDI